MAVAVGVPALLDVGAAREAPGALPPAPARPPQQPAVLAGQLALPGAHACAQLLAALVLALPVLGAVQLPVLAEVRGEGLRQQQQLDVVAAGGNVLLGVLLAVLDDAVARAARVKRVALLLHGVDEVVGAAALLAAPQAAGEGHDEAAPFDQLAPPGPADDDNLCVHAAQAAVGNADPAPRPAHAALPLARGPEQQRRHNARDEADFLQHVDQPVLRPADALAVVARPQPQQVEEDGDPHRQQRQHECVLPPPRPQRQVLAAQAGLEDEQVEVDLRRRAGQERGGVAERGRARGLDVDDTVGKRVLERRRCHGVDGRVGGRRALDNLVERRHRRAVGRAGHVVVL